jgi:hypothetical protein
VLHTKLEAASFGAAPGDLHLQYVYKNLQCQLLDAAMLDKKKKGKLAHFHQNTTAA